MAIAQATHGLLGAISAEVEVPYTDNTTWILAVFGGDVSIQRWSKGKAAKVNVYNGTVLNGEEVEIKTQSSTGLLYMTASTGVTYIDFVRKYPESNS